MICKISTSKTPRPCKILKNLSKTLTFCSFLCICSFLGFSHFLDLLSLQPLGWAPILPHLQGCYLFRFSTG